MITSKMSAVYFSLLALIIFCFHGNNGLLFHSECQINSTDTNCLLKRINEMNNQISRLEAKQVPSCPDIAFMAYLRRSLKQVQSGLQLKFGNVQLNSGNACKPFHGNFIAPVSGTYFFTYTAATNPKSWIRIYLKRNCVIVGQLINTALSNYLKTTESVVIHLNQSDDIWLEAYEVSANTNIASGTECHFAGFLLRCD